MECSLKSLNHALGANAPCNLQGQAFPARLVHDRQAFEFRSVCTGVVNEVHAPDMGWPPCAKLGFDPRFDTAALLGFQMQTLLLPDPVHSFEVERLELAT
jgi:hypothetical protein